MVERGEENFQQQRARVRRRLYEPEDPYSFTEEPMAAKSKPKKKSPATLTAPKNQSKPQAGRARDRKMKGARMEERMEERRNQFDFLTSVSPESLSP